MSSKMTTKTKEYVIRWSLETHATSNVEAESPQSAIEKARQNEDTDFHILEEKQVWVINMITGK